MRTSPGSAVSRSVAASLGGYVIANLVAIAITVALPMSQVDALLTAMPASFAVYACAAIWAFSAKSSLAAWGGLAMVGLLAAVVWLACSTVGTAG